MAVDRILPNGGVLHKPPCTKEEEAELYRRMSGIRTIMRPAAARTGRPSKPTVPRRLDFKDDG